ncbi:MAG: InlB B-repeat-containing protein, partial [Bifidobacteriaceae bacterium]|nr:InlB B-repeat-containing protein [Bifidobacteriaceae bacterium]
MSRPGQSNSIANHDARYHQAAAGLRPGRRAKRAALAGLMAGALAATGVGVMTGPAAAAAAAPAAALQELAANPVWAAAVIQPAAADTIHFSKQPVERSTYARQGTMRLSVQAEATDGSALTYQWKWSTKADKSSPQNVTGQDGSDTRAVLTATAPDTPSTYYYWVEVTAGDTTAPSSVAQVVVVNRAIKDTATKYDSYQYLYTSLQNGDFTALNTSNTYTLNITPDTTGFPSFGWQTTHYATTASYRPRAIELRGNGRAEDNHPAGTSGETVYTGYGLQAQDELLASQHGAYVEMSAAASSSLFQEIATVPGKVYEWSMDHITRKPYTEGTEAVQNRPDVMAVVIGAGINTEADYGSTTDYYNKTAAGTNILTAGELWNNKTLDAEANGGPYTYGVNQYTYFQAIVNKVLTENNIQAGEWDSTNVNDYFAASFNSVDRSYSTTYNGHAYYVFISSATRDLKYGTAQAETGSRWRHRSGSYSVPAGQGTTVFAFVNVYSSSAGTGNLIDNIKFASGSAPDSQQEVSYEGDSAVKAVTTKEGYAYALAEVRGSTVYQLQERDVWFTPTGGEAGQVSVNTAVGDGVSWYTPGAGGLEFRNLGPGKTYRLVGLPLGAISAALGTNVSPGDVFDEGYYSDVTVKAGKNDVGADGIGPNLSAAIYTAGQDGADDPIYKGKIILGVTDSRAEYTLLTKDANQAWVPVDATGQALAANAPASAANWQAGTGVALVFTGLTPGLAYRLIARPAGYTELTWSVVAANTTSGVIEITIPEPGKDVTADMLERHSTGSTDTVSLSDGDATVTYHLLDATSGKELWQGSGQTDYTISVGADTQDLTLQVLAEIAGTFTQGTRVYPYPEFVAAKQLTIDFEAESVGVAAGPVPADVQFKISYNNVALITGSTDSDGFLTAGGGARIQLGVATSYTAAPVLDTVISGSATLSYRLAKEASYDGEYVAPVSQLAVPARPAGPSSFPSSVWADEAVNGQSFADYGWTGLADLTVQLTTPAQAGVAFRSKPASFVIKQRPAAPTGLSAAYQEGTGLVVSGLDDAVAYQMSVDGQTGWGPVTVGGGQASLGTGSTYYLRFAATTSQPASLATKASDFPFGLSNLTFGAVAYGYAAPASQPVTVVNKATSPSAGSVEATLTIEDQQKDGAAFEGMAFTVDGAATATVPVLDASGSADLFQVKAASGLAAGTYTAKLVLNYTGSSGATTAEAQVAIVVNKTPWAAPTLGHTVTVTGNQLEAAASSGVPDAAQVEYSLDQAAWQDSGVFAGLVWGTGYEVFARLKADSNHEPSPVVVLIPAVYTDYATPVWADVLRVNYAAETIEFQPGVAPAGYQVTAGGETLGANASLTAFADAGGGQVTLVRAGSSDPKVGPGSSEAVSQAVPGRPDGPSRQTQANPTGQVGTVPAGSPTDPTGQIVHAGGTGFEYRVAGSTATWTTAASGTATGVAYGTYEVRYPATAAAFASTVLGGVFVNYAGNDFAVSWGTPTDQVEASGSQITQVVDATSGEQLQSGWTVVGAHQVEVTATTNPVAGGFYRWTWLVNAVRQGDPQVTTTPTAQLAWTVTEAASVALTVEAFYHRTLAFDPNGATGTVTALENTQADPDYDVVLPDGAGFSRSGYRFMGWNTAQNGSGTGYGPGGAYTLAADEATLYAQWASTAAELLSLGGKQVTKTGGAGSQGDPCRAAIAVANNVTAVPVGSAYVSDKAAVALYTDDAYTAQGAVALTDAGTAYHAYLKVTAEDNLTITYWDVTVTRDKSSDASLYSLGGQTYAAGTTTYTVAYGVAHLAVGDGGNIQVAPYATAEVNGGASAALAVGANPVTITVTAQDGTVATYGLTVTREPSGAVTLVAVGGASVTLANPGDGSGTTPGNPSEASAAPDTSVTRVSAANLATEADSGATATLWNDDFTQELTDPVVLTPGSPVVLYIKVASPSGAAYYKVTVTRDKSHDAGLLQIAGQAVDTTTSPVEVAVPYGVAQLGAADVVASAYATVVVTPDPAELQAGQVTDVEVQVTAQDGTTAQTYQVKVSRPAAPNLAPTGKDPAYAVTVQAGQAVSFTAADVAVDPDGDTVTITQLVSGPAGATATASLAAGTVTVRGAAAGSTNLVVEVTDGEAVAQVTVPVTVTAPPFTPKFSVIALSPDLNGDGRGEVLAVDTTTGALYRFGPDTAVSKLSGTAIVKSGLTGHQVYGPGDWDGDKKNDIITVDPAGNMWLRKGDGKGSLATPIQIGRGWSNYRVVPAGDLNSDKA